MNTQKQQEIEELPILVRFQEGLNAVVVTRWREAALAMEEAKRRVAGVPFDTADFTCRVLDTANQEVLLDVSYATELGPDEICVVCGCTFLDPCEEGCAWVHSEGEPPLCSACEERLDSEETLVTAPDGKAQAL